MKHKKRALFQSIISLILCCSMLAGTTFAWFTDSVSSTGNIIKSGNLKIGMEWTADLENPDWQDASQEAIFDYSDWEPGYTDLKYLKISNKGNLAFQYQLTIEEGSAPVSGIAAEGGEPDASQGNPQNDSEAAAVNEAGGIAGGEGGNISNAGNSGNITPGTTVSDAMKLAEVIDVYYANVTNNVPSREDAMKLTKVGTLADLINDRLAAAEGILLADGSEAGANASANMDTGSTTACIMLKMREEAGNAYMGLKPENGYCVKVIATQYAYEKDGFGSDYDTGAAKEHLKDFSNSIGSISGTIAVETDDNGLTTAEASIGGEEGGATIPTGVQVEEGTTELTLAVTRKNASEANITSGDNEELIPLDVHITGVSANNTTPIRVNLGKILPEGMNIGNVTLYHVENGATNPMTQVFSLEELDAHNEFYYDPVTGSVTVAMATFSEVALLSDKEAIWEGKIAEEFAGGDGSKDNPYIIANADQLAYLNKVISNDNENYGNKHYRLVADINFQDSTWYPIGYWKEGSEAAAVAWDEVPEAAYIIEEDTKSPASAAAVTDDVWYTYGGSFKGTFDGAGHTVSNIYQNTWEMDGDYDNGYWNDAMGLFGYVNGGTVKNLTVDNFSSDGEFTPTGVIAAYAANSTFENIAITNCNPRVYNTGNGGIVGIGGNSSDTSSQKMTFTNITIDNTNKISALWGSWDVACGGLMGMFRGYSTVKFTNCHVAAQIDVFNDVCGNYQYYWYRYAGMMIGSLRGRNTTDAQGYTVPDMTGITAENCTVHFGNWNDYYYCELVANSLASYTHDHQFSRLDQISSLDEIKSGDTWTKTGNFLLISGDTKTCYHIVNKDGVLTQHNHADAGEETVDGKTVLKENNQIVYLPFNQLFQGDGWGVKHIPIYNDGKTYYEGITILDRPVADSVVKFDSKFTGDFLYRVGNQNTMTIGDLFAAKEGTTINDAGVYVRIDKVYEDANVTCVFTADKTDWTKGTLKFEGTGVVDIVIQDYDYCIPTVLHLEVVNAYNRTTANFSGNSVLLKDVDVSSTSGISTSGIVYGNGFTVKMENAPISEKNGAVFHLYDGAILKNLNIVGKEFTTVSMNVNDTNYGVSAVRAWGTVVIENCYISGCRSAVSVTGTELTIKDSVIANGIYANVDFRSGILNLHNVTTINEPHSVNGTTVVGLGIVGNMTASAGRSLNITGTLTQYNWVSKADCANIKASGVESIFNSVFTEDKYSSLRYTYNGTNYVNTGILSLCSDFTNNAVNGYPVNYNGMDVTATISGVTVNGYVWAPAKAGTLTAEDMQYHGVASKPGAGNQGTSYIPPAFDFVNSGLEVENGVVQISYESGSSYTLSNATLKSLLTAEKYGQPLGYTIKMDGTDYTNSDITFSEAASGTYTIIYTITDNLVFDENGNLTGTTYEVTKELKVFATVVDKGADAPKFTFYYGTNGSASADTPHTTQPTNEYTSTIKQIGDTYYIMPNVSTTTANAIGSQSVDGETVYYPIVDGINVRSGNSSDYDFTRYYPIFKAVTISDNDAEYSYDKTKEMPATVTWVSATIDVGNGASSLNDGFGLYNNQYLCKIQKKAGDAESGGTSIVKYSYVALDGNTYNYYVGYRFYNEDEGGLCITPDTLITLADGKQVRVDSLTGSEKLLVWNHETGTFDSAPVAYIVNHDEEVKAQEITRLTFSDGNEVKIIGEHVFFDATLNRYVPITGDNAKNYINHVFTGVNNTNDALTAVNLVKAETYVEETAAYEVVSYKHLTCFTNNLLSTSAYLDKLLNIFDINTATMAYSTDKVSDDIAKYGLYTYADFDGLISEEAFELYNAQYLKIAVGKGYITWDDILELIDIYFNVDVQPIN